MTHCFVVNMIVLVATKTYNNNRYMVLTDDLLSGFHHKQSGLRAYARWQNAFNNKV